MGLINEPFQLASCWRGLFACAACISPFALGQIRIGVIVFRA